MQQCRLACVLQPASHSWAKVYLHHSIIAVAAAASVASYHNPEAFDHLVMSQSVEFQLRIQRTFNGSLVAMLTGLHNASSASFVLEDSSSSMTSKSSSYSSQSSIGALYYVIAVVVIYGFSIILMIGSQIRKNKHDKGISRFNIIPHCASFSFLSFLSFSSNKCLRVHSVIYAR